MHPQTQPGIQKATLAPAFKAHGDVFWNAGGSCRHRRPGLNEGKSLRLEEVGRLQHRKDQFR